MSKKRVITSDDGSLSSYNSDSSDSLRERAESAALYREISNASSAPLEKGARKAAAAARSSMQRAASGELPSRKRSIQDLARDSMHQKRAKALATANSESARQKQIILPLQRN